MGELLKQKVFSIILFAKLPSLIEIFPFQGQADWYTAVTSAFRTAGTRQQRNRWFGGGGHNLSHKIQVEVLPPCPISTGTLLSSRVQNCLVLPKQERSLAIQATVFLSRPSLLFLWRQTVNSLSDLYPINQNGCCDLEIFFSYCFLCGSWKQNSIHLHPAKTQTTKLPPLWKMGLRRERCYDITTEPHLPFYNEKSIYFGHTLYSSFIFASDSTSSCGVGTSYDFKRQHFAYLEDKWKKGHENLSTFQSVMGFLPLEALPKDQLVRIPWTALVTT